MTTPQQRIAPPPHYRALFGAALRDLPGAATLPCRRRREESFARFEAHGFPGPKAEAWKYTQLAPLAKLEFRAAGSRSRRAAPTSRPSCSTMPRAPAWCSSTAASRPSLSDDLSAGQL